MAMLYYKIRSRFHRDTNGDTNHDIESKLSSQPSQRRPDETSGSITIRYENDKQTETDCAICLEEFKDGDSCRVLSKCNHVFHGCYIDQWLLQHGTCPLCRGEGHGFRPTPDSTNDHD
ncbi:RING-H2 finger protein ATL14-like [Hibiscus syriacus]|nr:RING-H2 finger protein ATL14-like [Hibiscus syriacus]